MVDLLTLGMVVKAVGYGSLGVAGWSALHLFTTRERTKYDLFHHVYLVGGTGSGKTNAMKWEARRLFDQGWSVWWLSVQHRSADELLSSLPADRLSDVTWICPDEPAPLKLNLLSCSRNTPDEWALISEQTVAIFQQQDAAWGAHIGEVLGNAVYAVLEWGAGKRRIVTLWDAVRVLCEDDFRAEVVGAVTQQAVRQFFEAVYPSLKTSVIRAVARILRLLRNDHLLRVLSSPDTISVGDLMARPGLRFVVADMHGLGSKLASALFLSIVVSKIEALTYGRNAWATPCALFLDEFPLYETTALANLLEQGRRHNMSLWLACQGRWQGHVASTSAWQTGTWHIFRPEATDDGPKIARILDVPESELKVLPDCVSYSRELIRGRTQKPKRQRWRIYPNGSQERLEEIKRELLRARSGIKEPEIRLPNVPVLPADPSSPVPSVPGMPKRISPAAPPAAEKQPEKQTAQPARKRGRMKL